MTAMLTKHRRRSMTVATMARRAGDDSSSTKEIDLHVAALSIEKRGAGERQPHERCLSDLIAVSELAPAAE